MFYPIDIIYKYYLIVKSKPIDCNESVKNIDNLAAAKKLVSNFEFNGTNNVMKEGDCE